MEEMLATLPRVVSVSAVSGGCLTALDPSAPSQGTQGGGGGGGVGGGGGGAGSSGSQEDPRCNGTLRKLPSPRLTPNVAGTTLAPGQGRTKRTNGRQTRIGQLHHSTGTA